MFLSIGWVPIDIPPFLITDLFYKLNVSYSACSDHNLKSLLKEKVNIDKT